MMRHRQKLRSFASVACLAVILISGSAHAGNAPSSRGQAISSSTVRALWGNRERADVSMLPRCFVCQPRDLSSIAHSVVAHNYLFALQYVTRVCTCGGNDFEPTAVGLPADASGCRRGIGSRDKQPFDVLQPPCTDALETGLCIYVHSDGPMVVVLIRWRL